MASSNFDLKIATCSFCSKERPEGLLRCAQCKNAHYCDKDCQKNHWKSHKLLCKPPGPPQPNPNGPLNLHNKEVPTTNDVTNPSPSPSQTRSSLDRPIFTKPTTGGSPNIPKFLWLDAPNNSRNNNLIMMLHGCGDTEQSMADLAKKMHIPQTACLSIRGLLALPFDLGYEWFPSFNEDGSLISGENKNDKRRIDGLVSSTRAICAFLSAYQQAGGWSFNHVFLFGFRQGALLAVNVALTLGHKLGGVIGISSECLLPEITGLIPASDPLNISSQIKDTCCATFRWNNKTESNNSNDNNGNDCRTPFYFSYGLKDPSISPPLYRKFQSIFKALFPKTLIEINEVTDKKVPEISSQGETEAMFRFLVPLLYLEQEALRKLRDQGVLVEAFIAPS